MEDSTKKQLHILATRIRMGAVTGVFHAKSGHPGGSLSIADLLAYLYTKELRVDPQNPKWSGRDRLVLSKGHCAPALYAALALRGFFPEEELLSAAYSLELKSEHPLARAIVGYCGERNIRAGEVTKFEALRGSGLSAVMDGRECVAGNMRLAETYCDLPEEMRARAEKLSGEGKTPLFFCREKRLIGVIAVADTIKEDSPQAIRELKNMGIRTVMLTGDNERTAAALHELPDPAGRLTILSFTKQVPLYLRACDLLFSKPGGLTSTEAAVSGIPLIHTDPIPGCETVNREYFESRGMSLSARTPEEQVQAGLRILHDPALRDAMLQNQHKGIHPDAADRIYDAVKAAVERRNA